MSCADACLRCPAGWAWGGLGTLVRHKCDGPPHPRVRTVGLTNTYLPHAKSAMLWSAAVEQLLPDFEAQKLSRFWKVLAITRSCDSLPQPAAQQSSTSQRFQPQASSHLLRFPLQEGALSSSHSRLWGPGRGQRRGTGALWAPHSALRLGLSVLPVCCSGPCVVHGVAPAEAWRCRPRPSACRAA